MNKLREEFERKYFSFTTSSEISDYWLQKIVERDKELLEKLDNAKLVSIDKLASRFIRQDQIANIVMENYNDGLETAISLIKGNG